MEYELNTANKVTSNASNENCDPELSSKSTIKERCPLCSGLQANFTCTNCINRGDFISASQTQVTFLQKKEEFLKVLEERDRLYKMCKIVVKRQASNDLLPQEINECREKIKTLKCLIQEKKSTIEKAEARLVVVRGENKAKGTRLPRYRTRCEKMSTYVRREMRQEIAQHREKLSKKQAELKHVVQENIEQLIKIIFPIEKIVPTSKSAASEDSDVVSALAEASKTSFVRGTWVLMDSSGELHHRIVSPTLPGSGHYSAYLAGDRDGVPITEQIAQNEAFNVGAALCYTTQLVSLLGFYLDVILPKKVNFSDFCIRDLTDRQFHRKVAWLNANVLYLCFSQGMDTVLLNPKHTLNNLLNLIQHADLGQSGPFTVDSGVVLSLECDEEFKDEGSDDEEGDVLEWEAIPLVPCPESPPGAAMSTTQQSASIAGGLVTSLASMFRGWSK